MHICFLTSEYPKPGYPHGGIATFLKSIAEGLAENQIKATIITVLRGADKEITEQEGLITVHYLPQSKWKALKFLDNSRRVNQKLRQIHQKDPIDVVEGSEIALGLIRKLPGIKYVIRMNGGHHYFAKFENRPTEWQKVWKEKRSFKVADALISVSEFTNTETSKLLGFNPANTSVILNGVEVKNFVPGNASEIVPGRIVFVGAVVEKKGIRQLVMAMPEVLKKFPHAKLLVLGNTGKKHFGGGMYIDYLKSHIDPAATDAIEFVGFVENNKVKDYIRSAEVCVYPSHMEALPFAWVEVLAMEKLLIGGSTGPGPEVIKHLHDGLLCDPHDPKDVADKIIYALAHPEEARQMAVNARKTAFEKFDMAKLTPENISFYKKLAGKA